MKAASIFAVEGVLTKEGVSGPPMLPGKMLLAGLLTQTQVFFLTEEPNRQLVINWLYDELSIAKPKIIGPEIEDPIRTTRYLGWDVSFFVSPSPSLCSMAMAQGVVSLVFAAPAYQRPEFRPDYRGPARAWAEIEAEMEAQKADRAMDDRNSEDFHDRSFMD